MIATLEADPGAYDRLVRIRWRNASITAFVTVPPAVGILVFDYRGMLFAIIVLAPLLLTVIDAVRAQRAAKTLGPCRLSWDDTSVTLQSSATTVRMALPAPIAPHAATPRRSNVITEAAGLRLVRAQPDALVIVEGRSATQMRIFLVPSTSASAAPFLEHVRRHDVPVHHEKQIGISIAGFLIGTLLSLGIGKVAVALVALGLAQIGLWALDRSGSPSVGLGFLAGALVLLALNATLTKYLLSPAGTRDTGDPQRPQ